MKHEVVDGVDRFSFRQSWLGTFAMCPEQARLDMRGELPRVETDATAIGTAVHTAIEHVLLKNADYDDALQVALVTFADLEALDNFQYVKAKTFGTCTQYVTNCFTSWYQHVYPQLGEPLSVERTFKVKLAEGLSKRIVIPTQAELWLSGTWDLDDSAWGLVDWKNKGQEIKRWEVDRFGIQPTVYTYAKRVLDDLGMDGELPFTFVNMIKGPSITPPQIVTVYRHAGHYEWLKTMLWRIVDLYWQTDMGASPWPLNDAGWFCSERWCKNWAGCKGADLASVGRSIQIATHP